MRISNVIDDTLPVIKSPTDGRWPQYALRFIFDTEKDQPAWSLPFYIAPKANNYFLMGEQSFYWTVF